MVGDISNLRFALAHDWLVGLRGGELVLDRLARLTGPVPLYTLVDNGGSLTDAIDGCDVRTSFLQKIPDAQGALRRWLLPLMPLAVDRFKVDDCDVLLSTSSCVIKGITPPKDAIHICFCHSPARYLWSQMENYNGLMGVGLRAVRGPFRDWDKRTAANVHQFVASSTYIAERIASCFDRDALVIHPPVRTDFFTCDDAVDREDFWLLTAALEPFKRVDLAIEAANRRRHRLIIAGTGSQEKALRQLAGDTVEFVGQQDAMQVRDLARRARLFLFPSLEDFGIAPVEAMACGCPVVALNRGGALDTVNATCGSFMEDQTVDALLEAVDAVPDDAVACRTNAERFSEARFDDEMLRCIRVQTGLE